MKRRGFLGLMGGAVVSGPTLAKSLSEQAIVGGGAPMPSYGGVVGSAVGSAASDTSWITKEIAQVRSLLSGRNPEREREIRQQAIWSLENRDRYRIDSLRSVSPVSRHAMFTKGENARRDEMRRLDLEGRLSWLERRLLGGD